MPPTSHSRGHEIIYKQGIWQYVDNGKPISNMRPCKHCGRLPTKEGYDACIGHILHAVSVCCGHGRKEDKVLI